MPGRIEIERISYRYPGETRFVLKDISLKLEPGRVVCLVGPSGCGKTTLLNIVANLLAPECGNVRFHDGSGEGRRIGYIFQFDALLPWRNVHGNIRLGLEIAGRKPDDTFDEKVITYLKSFNLDETILHQYPSQLSGGMRQRVAIIQSLMYQPNVLLLDEPFAALDFYTKLTLEREFWNLIKTENKAALLVTHDIDEAIAIGDRVLVMEANPGAIIADYEIRFDGGVGRDPAEVRGLPDFAHYFDQIWKTMGLRRNDRVLKDAVLA
ncbi:MAG TPA: ABC transporter ATP-binding protein [Gammaproteobacteria bacterium]|nr:ABC transporter ATP-binding protein [Gammaproteobacteria bacterium]